MTTFFGVREIVYPHPGGTQASQSQPYYTPMSFAVTTNNTTKAELARKKQRPKTKNALYDYFYNAVDVVTTVSHVPEIGSFYSDL